MPIFAFLKACALCFWVVMTAHHVNVVHQFSVLSCSRPVPSASPRGRLLKAVWCPSRRCFVCVRVCVCACVCVRVSEQVSSCRSAISPHVHLRAEPGSQSPYRHVARDGECVQHAQRVCRMWCSDFLLENKFLLKEPKGWVSGNISSITWWLALWSLRKQL